MNYQLFPADHSRRRLGKHDSQLAPFTEDSIDFHPHLLINYLYQAKEEPVAEKDVPRASHIREVWTDGVLRTETSQRHVELMGDSGGFQGASLGRDIDPVACMQWQNRNCDIAFIVDKIPVRHPKDGSTLLFNEIASQIAGLTATDSYFQKCAEETARNLDLALQHKDEDVKLYSIIQGNDYHTKKKWLEIVSREHDVDGFGIKGTSNSEVMSAFMLIREQFPKTPVHFLGCGSFSRIAPLIYFSKYHEERVTSDASSHLQGTKSRLYLDPITHKKWRILPDDKPAQGPGEINGVTDLPCWCNACRFAADEHIDRNSSMFGRALTLHNLRMMLTMVEELKYSASHPEFFKAAIKEFNPDAKQEDGWSLSSIIDCIEDIHHEGVDFAKAKYLEHGKQNVMDFL